MRELNLNSNKMTNFKNFNRHECFDEKMFNFFSTVKKDIVDWAMFEEVKISSFKNSLFGIWDGYLYDGLLTTAKELGVPEFLIFRLEIVVKHIEKSNTITEEEVTNINLS